MVWNHLSRLTTSNTWTGTLRIHKRKDSGTNSRSRNRTDGFQSPMVRLFHVSLSPLICARPTSRLQVVRLPTHGAAGCPHTRESRACLACPPNHQSPSPPCQQTRRRRRQMSSASPQSSASPPQTTPKSANAAAADANIRNFAPVARIMKMALPENAKIAKEAKECMQECVSEFISFITSEGESPISVSAR